MSEEEITTERAAGRGSKAATWTELAIFFALLLLYCWNHASFLQGMMRIF